MTGTDKVRTDSCPNFEFKELDFESETRESELASFERPASKSTDLRSILNSLF